MQDIRDIGPRDEMNVLATLYIEGKGELVLYSPTRASFTGGGPIHIRSIKDCQLEVDYTYYTHLRFNTVAEVVENYDAVYESVQQSNGCVEYDD